MVGGTRFADLFIVRLFITFKIEMNLYFSLFGQIEMALNFGNMHLFDHLLTLPGAPRRYIAPQHCLACALWRA